MDSTPSTDTRPMDPRDPTLQGEFTWRAEELASRYPPRWQHRNKLVVATIATPADAVHDGEITVSRWRGGDLPERLTAPVTVREEGFFTYPATDPDDATTHWHMNFADPLLFGFGEGPLLAQDELQIAEHPCLCSVARAIEQGAHGQDGLVRATQEGEEATPVLVEGVPRRCALDTSDLYGDNFARASADTVHAATRRIIPPTRSNIVALAAMRPEYGDYDSEQIRRLLRTAYTGFRSLTLRSGRVTLHTGYWGCGAFGGNKGLVSAIQLLAAGAAGVERVRFWWGFTPLDRSALEHAIAVAEHLDGAPVDDVVSQLAAAGYRWGEANENHVPFEPPARCLLSD